MSKKKHVDAETSVRTAQHNRWRCLLRNPKFREDLQRLSTLPNEELFADEYKVAAAWGLVRIPLEAIRGADLLREPQNVRYLDPLGLEPLVAYSPIAVTGFRENHLFLRVDLAHPAGDLTPLFHNEIRAWRQRATSKKRRRFDKVDFQLEVYDRAAAGHKFSQIATRFGCPIPTVKTAYVAALQNIYGPSESPPKKELVISNVDVENHFKNCRVCNDVDRAVDTRNEFFCPEIQVYISQETRGQREITGLDPQRNIALGADGKLLTRGEQYWGGKRKKPLPTLAVQENPLLREDI